MRPAVKSAMASLPMARACFCSSLEKIPRCSDLVGNPRRRKKSRALRPTSTSSIDCPGLSTMNWPAALMTFELKLPARPLSAETTIS